MMKRTICMLAALSLALCSFPAAAQSVDATARLTELGYLREETGDMRAAVRNFQIANDLEVTGGLDTATLQALSRDDAISKRDYLLSIPERYPAEPLKSGSTGEDVRAMQRALRDLGYYQGQADGVFGDGTRRGDGLPDRQRPGGQRRGRPRHAAAFARGTDADLAGLSRRQALPAGRFRRRRALFAAAAQADGLF